MVVEKKGGKESTEGTLALRGWYRKAKGELDVKGKVLRRKEGN